MTFQHVLIIEYVSADLRTTKKDQTEKKDQHKDRYNRFQKGCWIHDSIGHSISPCTTYVSKSDAERIAFLKENQACWNCLIQGHRISDCATKTKCPIDNCNRPHSETLRNACVEGNNL